MQEDGCCEVQIECMRGWKLLGTTKVYGRMVAKKNTWSVWEDARYWGSIRCAGVDNKGCVKDWRLWEDGGCIGI